MDYSERRRELQSEIAEIKKRRTEKEEAAAAEDRRIWYLRHVEAAREKLLLDEAELTEVRDHVERHGAAEEDVEMEAVSDAKLQEDMAKLMGAEEGLRQLIRGSEELEAAWALYQAARTKILPRAKADEGPLPPAAAPSSASSEAGSTQGSQA